MLTTNHTLAGTLSAVNSSQCEQLVGSAQPFILVLKKNENVIEGIECCATDAKLLGASLSGIGAIKNVDLSYYNLEDKTYNQKQCPQFLELVVLTLSVPHKTSSLSGLTR